jgi:sporulation protein YlmC with PRC-barrel domain
MDISIGAEVHCADGPCGRSTYVVINPLTQNVTHLVVREEQDPLHTERLVPINMVVESTPDQIALRSTREQLAKEDPFIVTEFIRSDVPEYVTDRWTVVWPYVTPRETMATYLHKSKQVPPGELTLRRGARVEAIDGHVGRVDEFVVDAGTGHITHLVLREGHLWGQKDVSIPISEINRIEADVVYLKLDKAGVEALPTIPVQRDWP